MAHEAKQPARLVLRTCAAEWMQSRTDLAEERDMPRRLRFFATNMRLTTAIGYWPKHWPTWPVRLVGSTRKVTHLIASRQLVLSSATDSSCLSSEDLNIPDFAGSRHCQRNRCPDRGIGLDLLLPVETGDDLGHLDADRSRAGRQLSAECSREHTGPRKPQSLGQ
jgi:hypothetical protein